MSRLYRLQKRSMAAMVSAASAYIGIADIAGGRKPRLGSWEGGAMKFKWLRNATSRLLPV
eukprot:3624770-Alexandrium_andersonii.AAC.1